MLIALETRLGIIDDAVKDGEAEEIILSAEDDVLKVDESELDLLSISANKVELSEALMGVDAPSSDVVVAAIACSSVC